MDPDLERRIEKVIERRNHARRTGQGREAPIDRERRLARERVMNELPRLAAKVAGAVAEVNELLVDAELSMAFKALEHLPAAEASFEVTLSDHAQDAPSLLLSVDHSGLARAVLRHGDARSLLESANVFALDRTEITGLLVSLLEAYYH